MKSPMPVEVSAIEPDGPSRALLDALAGEVCRVLGVEVRRGGAISAGEIGCEVAVGAPFPSNRLIDGLIERDGAPDPPTVWLVAVTGRDLCVPGRDFVFGEATLGGGWAVVSTARLSAGSEDEPATLDRLLKTAVHEVGHLAGLAHCDRPNCAMHPATTPSDVDARREDFCEVCFTAFRRGCGLDPP